MRLPIISEEQAVGQGVAPTASLAQYGQVGAAGRDLAEVGQVGGTRLLAQGLELEARQRKIAQSTEAMDIFTDAAKKAEALQLALKTAPDMDPLTHVDRYEAGFKEIQAEAMARSQDPAVQTVTRRLLQRLGLEKSLEAQKQAHAMFVDSEKAAVNQTLENMEKMAAEATTPEGRTFYTGLAQGFLASKRGVLTEQQIQKLGSDFTERTNVNAARQAIDADPFNADVSPYLKHMDPAKAEQMKTYQVRQQQSVLALEDRAARRLEKAEEQYRRAVTDQFERGVQDRTVTVQTLDAANDARVVIGEDYRRMRATLLQPKDGPSDPDVLTGLSSRAHRTVPTVTLEELSRAHEAYRAGRPGLSYKDWKELSDKVVARGDHLRAEGRTGANEGRSINMQRHAQAEQILDRALGLSSPYDVLNKEDQKLQDAGLRELTVRSSAFGGQEDPLKVAQEIAARITPDREKQIGLKAETIRKTLIYPDQAQLEAAKASNQISPSLYELERQKFLSIKRAQERMNPTPTGSAPAPPKPNSLRPPGTPAVKGPIE